MKTLDALTDPTYNAEKVQHNALDKMFVSMIKDPRDLPFVYLTLKITFSMIVAGVLLFTPIFTGWQWALLAVVYTVLNNFIFKGSFGLMLHCTSHRPWFKSKYKLFNYYLPWFVGLFFGQTPETYFSHHIGMHHLENNLDDDESSTMQYRRDSFRGFMHYLMRFLLIGLITLGQYFFKKNRKKLMRKIIRGELFFFLMCVLLSLINFKATLVVFVIPFFISRFIMMLGNWAQHAFIDQENPDDLYLSSITCINTNYNHKCWNDGYHISHHLKPSMHWTEHPNHFRDNMNEYAERKAIVFDGIHFLHVWFYLMRKRYDKLLENLVNINGMFKSEEEALAMLKSRTKKFSSVPVRTLIPNLK